MQSVVFFYVSECTVSHPEYFDLINPMFIAEAFMNILRALFIIIIGRDKVIK